MIQFRPQSDLDILFVEHAHNPRGDFGINDSLEVHANDVSAKFLEKNRALLGSGRNFSWVAKLTYDDVVTFQLIWLGLDALWA